MYHLCVIWLPLKNVLCSDIGNKKYEYHLEILMAIFNSLIISNMVIYFFKQALHN